MHSEWKSSRGSTACAMGRDAMDARPRPMPCRSASIWLAACLLLASLPGMRIAHAQDGASDTRIQRIADLAKSAEAGPPDVARLPQREGAGKQDDDVSYDLKQRPAAPPQLNLSTTVETRVENRTTNNISGGAGGKTDGSGPSQAQPREAERPARARAAIDFRTAITQSLGRELPVFGEDLFRNDARMTGSDPLTVPADYRNGPADEELIRAWGLINIDFQGPVSRSGTVFLPGIGEVMLSGMRLDEARAMLRGIVSTQYKDFELVVSLAKLRDIQVYLAGFVESPGLHTVPSTATALQGLLASGGPGPGADLRRIQVKRAGRVVATFDAYRFLVDGDKSGDPQLLPGDVIHLPAAKGFVAIAVSVRRPAF